MKTRINLLAAGIFLATLGHVFSQPNFIKQPTSQSVSLGVNVQFVSLATSTNPPTTYHWRLAATNLAAETKANLSRTNIQLPDAGDYDVVATDSFGISATGLVGQSGTTAFTDTNAVGAGTFFYRVGVLP